MNKESEVKYIVNSLPKDLESPIYIEQYYFNPTNIQEELKKEFKLNSLDDIHTFRVRKIKQNNQIKYILTLKTSGLITRDEYEKEINDELFNKIISNPIDSLIIKNRYKDYYNDFCFEFDEYLNLNLPLISVEVEYDNVLEYTDHIEKILKDHYKLEYNNVTFDHRYKNSNLIKYFGGNK